MTMANSAFRATVLAGALALTGALPAQAQVSMSFQQRNQVIESYCDRYPNDYDCRGYYDGGWRDDDYNNFYSSRRSNLDSVAAGLFGFTFGAILGSAITGSDAPRGRVIQPGYGNYDAHVAACFRRYRSYDEGTDSYMGYDGYRHRCNL